MIEITQQYFYINANLCELLISVECRSRKQWEDYIHFNWSEPLIWIIPAICHWLFKSMSFINAEDSQLVPQQGSSRFRFMPPYIRKSSCGFIQIQSSSSLHSPTFWFEAHVYFLVTWPQPVRITVNTMSGFNFSSGKLSLLIALLY